MKKNEKNTPHPPWAHGPHTKKHKNPLEMEPARARAHGPWPLALAMAS
jgi:hypothetical protein